MMDIDVLTDDERESMPIDINDYGLWIALSRMGDKLKSRVVLESDEVYGWVVTSLIKLCNDPVDADVPGMIGHGETVWCAVLDAWIKCEMTSPIPLRIDVVAPLIEKRGKTDESRAHGQTEDLPREWPLPDSG